jgi:fumarate reductase flavoprotein subunit
MVDRAGNRRVDESASYAIMEVRHRAYGPMCAVFDNAAKEAFQPGMPGAYKQVFPGTEGRALPSNWRSDNVDAMVASGKIKQAPTLEALAKLLAISPSGLTANIGRYNAFVDAGEDLDYFKDPKFLRAVASPPFYGAELRLGVLCLTSKGLRIDPSARVLSGEGVPIPGLYAAGECTGGVLGDVYMGSGNSYANCVVFGRTAGSTAVSDPAFSPEVAKVSAS